MTAFFALLRLQLLSRYADLKPRNLKTQMGEKKGRTIGMIILILFLVGYLGTILYIVETKMLDMMMQMGMPEMLISMAVLLCMAGTLILSFFFVMSSLFLGRDAAVLAALPIKSRVLLGAKLAQVWLSETGISAVILLPACILYGTRVGVDAGFYLRMIPIWLLISVIPICVISFVSSVLIRASVLWKRREIVMTVGGIVLMVGYMFLMMNLGSMTGGDQNSMDMIQQLVQSSQGRVEMITRAFPPAMWAGKGLLGDWGMLGLFAAVSIGAAALTIWLLGYNYRKLSLLQAETPTATKVKAGKENYSGSSVFKACAMREIKMILRVPSYATNILPITFMPLMMVILLNIAFNRSASADAGTNLQQVLSGLNPAIVMGILTAAMAYVAGMNPALSTAVSREGKGHDYLTALPVPVRTLIDAKFVVGYGLSLIGVLAASIAIAVILPAFRTQTILAFILCALFSFFHSVLALTRDVKKPRLDWVTEQEAVKQNFGLLISMLLSWAILAALAGLTYLMIGVLKLEMYPVFGILAAVLLVMCYFAYRHMRKATEKYYCAG